MFLDFKKFLDESYDKTTKRQKFLEQVSTKWAECILFEASQKEKLNAPKQKDATENCMSGLAAQLQFDHFGKAVETSSLRCPYT